MASTLREKKKCAALETRRCKKRLFVGASCFRINASRSGPDDEKTYESTADLCRQVPLLDPVGWLWGKYPLVGPRIIPI